VLAYANSGKNKWTASGDHVKSGNERRVLSLSLYSAACNGRRVRRPAGAGAALRRDCIMNHIIQKGNNRSAVQGGMRGGTWAGHQAMAKNKLEELKGALKRQQHQSLLLLLLLAFCCWLSSGITNRLATRQWRQASDLVMCLVISNLPRNESKSRLCFIFFVALHFSFSRTHTSNFFFTKRIGLTCTHANYSWQADFGWGNPEIIITKWTDNRNKNEIETR